MERAKNGDFKNSFIIHLLTTSLYLLEMFILNVLRENANARTRGKKIEGESELSKF